MLYDEKDLKKASFVFLPSAEMRWLGIALLILSFLFAFLALVPSLLLSGIQIILGLEAPKAVQQVMGMFFLLSFIWGAYFWLRYYKRKLQSQQLRFRIETQRKNLFLVYDGNFMQCYECATGSITNELSSGIAFAMVDLNNEKQKEILKAEFKESGKILAKEGERHAGLSIALRDYV